MLEISRTYLVYDYDITIEIKNQYVIDMKGFVCARYEVFFYLHIESWRVTLQQL